MRIRQSNRKNNTVYTGRDESAFLYIFLLKGEHNVGTRSGENRVGFPR